jgi:hypothetical protein
MKKSHRKLKAIIPGIALALMMPLSAQASSLEAIVESIERLRTEIMAWLESAQELYLEHLYEQSPNYPNTVAANASTPMVAPAMNTKNAGLALAGIKELLTQNENEQITRRLAAAPASDTFQETSSGQVISIGGKKKEFDPSEGDIYLYAGTLLSPLAYRSNKNSNGEEETAQDLLVPTDKAAFGYLQYAANMGQPIGINYSALNDNQKKLLESTPQGRQYRVALRSMIAARSLAMDNLIRSYSKRLPVDGLGEAAGIPNQENASPAELEHFIATRRATNPEWFASISQASEAAIARESLYVLVEIQQLLYGMRQDNERILATLSVMELNNLEQQKESLTAKEEAVKRTLKLNN